MATAIMAVRTINSSSGSGYSCLNNAWSMLWLFPFKSSNQYCWSSFLRILLFIHNICSCNLTMKWRMKMAILSNAFVDRYQGLGWTRRLHLRSRRAGPAIKNCLKYRDGRTVLPFRILRHFRFRNTLVYGEDGCSSFPRNDKPTHQTTRHHTSKFPQMVTLLICVREVRGSNLGLDAHFPVWGFSWFYSLSLKMHRYTSN